MAVTLVSGVTLVTGFTLGWLLLKAGHGRYSGNGSDSNRTEARKNKAYKYYVSILDLLK